MYTQSSFQESTPLAQVQYEGIFIPPLQLRGSASPGWDFVPTIQAAGCWLQGYHSMTAVCCCLSGTASRKSGHSRQEQQLGFLRERMEEFRTAALQAKKNKDLELAKQHIRMMKVCGPEIKLLFSALCCVFFFFWSFAWQVLWSHQRLWWKSTWWCYHDYYATTVTTTTTTTTTTTNIEEKNTTVTTTAAVTATTVTATTTTSTTTVKVLLLPLVLLPLLLKLTLKVETLHLFTEKRHGSWWLHWLLID